jgi:hypothetical protein
MMLSDGGCLDVEVRAAQIFRSSIRFVRKVAANLETSEGPIFACALFNTVCLLTLES